MTTTGPLQNDRSRRRLPMSEAARARLDATMRDRAADPGFHEKVQAARQFIAPPTP